jgi:4-hydroxyphenylpyruvate dioxygenase-like putative hemolysin
LRRREQDEADLTAVAAPDGTEVFFCRTEPVGGHGWLDDFLPTGEPVPAGVTAIDHLSLAQPFDGSTRRGCSTGRCWAWSTTRPASWPRRSG